MKFLISFAVFTFSVLATVSAEKSTACGLNERWTECGTACPLHCPIRNSRTGRIETGREHACDMMCQDCCQCAPGHLRDLKRGGQCVEKAACTPVDQEVPYIVMDEPKCGPNEVFTTCGSACPAHCPVKDPKTGQILPDTPIICPPVCKIGCVCAQGFVRDAKKSNACVEKSLCTAP